VAVSAVDELRRLRTLWTDRECRNGALESQSPGTDPTTVQMVPCFLLDKSGWRIAGTATATKEERLVSLVLVSHSATLVEGLREMVAQVAGADVRVTTAGGTEDGRLGTSAPRIADAIREAVGEGSGSRANGVLVLLDLGSAALSLEIALEELDEATRSIVRVSEAPLVEGAVIAAVQASTGASLDEVAAAAMTAATMSKFAGA
jgi:phosphoenolpyruvate---glycerone phosphotransferase subunit DhaM